MSEESIPKPLLITKEELRIIIYWRKHCEDVFCPLYSVEKGSEFCNELASKLMKFFDKWDEIPEGEK